MNYGFKKDVIVPEDYIFGGLTKIPKENLQPDKDWTPYLPMKEYQNLFGVETFACVTFTILNCVETLIKKKYNEERNYSDRFLAAISGTKEGGNSPKIVGEFLRKIGVVPQELWPFSENINTFDKFYEKVPPKLYKLANEFNAEWEFGYEYVMPGGLEEALISSPLLMSVSAWHQDKDGYYYNPGVSNNHATTYVKAVSNDYRLVFDSYDSVSKKVKWDTMPEVAMRFYIKKKAKEAKSWLVRLIEFIFRQ